MTKSDTSEFQLRDVAAALGLLSRLPVRIDGAWAAARGAAAAWAYPLVGLVLGLIAAIVVSVLGWLGLPSALLAGATLLLLIMMSGALHEDGLADCADGFWGGMDRDRRLAIMKDSRIGAYGVLALIIALGWRWVALAAAFDMGAFWVAIVVPAVVSRAAMVWVMQALPHARDTGLSQSVGRPTRSVALAAVALAGVIGAVLLGISIVWVALVSAAVTLAVCAVARAKIGGQTGDVLGATQQIVEIAALTVLIAG